MKSGLSVTKDAMEWNFLLLSSVFTFTELPMESIVITECSKHCSEHSYYIWPHCGNGVLCPFGNCGST